MKRSVAIFSLIAFCLGILGHAGWAWDDDYVALEELHLISWEYLPHGHPSHTGPVSAAVLMAWYAMHGYARLLPDLSGDGRVDEDDTVLLAQELAEVMAAGDREGICDPLVVDVLASYVEERYPNEFVMLLFDPSFPDEVRSKTGHPFDPWMYPGIEVVVLEEPTHEIYVRLLEEGRPGIVGYGHEHGENRYSVSRSREVHEQGGAWPVDLVNTDHAGFGPEAVWETGLRWEDGRWWFVSPEWAPFEIFIVLIPQDPAQAHADDGTGVPGTPPGGSSDGGSGTDQTPPPGSSTWGSGPGSSEPDPPPGSSSWGDDESSDLAISMHNTGLEPFDAAHAAPGEQVRYMLQVWHTGPDIPRSVVAELTIPFGVQVDWIGGNPAEMAGWPGRHFLWTLPEGSLQVANPAAGMTPGVDVWLEEFQITVDENICTTLDFSFEVSSATPDPNLLNNWGTLIESFGPCNGGSDPGGQPTPSGLPNLWATNVTGCWVWSADGQEHVVTTVTGIVHNGGQESASNVRARITAGGVSKTVYVGTLAAGAQKTISATVTIGAYDNVQWPVGTSITVDPSRQIEEADETNNTTDSSFPESNECN